MKGLRMKKTRLLLLSCIVMVVMAFGLTACSIDIHTDMGETIHIDMNDVDWSSISWESMELEELKEQLLKIYFTQIPLNDDTMAIIKNFMENNGFSSYYAYIEEAYEKDPEALRSVFSTGSIDGLVRLFFQDSSGSENEDAETPLRAFPGNLGGSR